MRIYNSKVVTVFLLVLISKAVIDSSISHYEFVLINNVLKEYDNIKDLNSSLKILVFLSSNVIAMFKVKKKHRK